MVARLADSGSQGVHSLGNQRASGLMSPWCPPLPRLWAKPPVPGNWPHAAAWDRSSAGKQALSSDAWAGPERFGTGSLQLQHPVQVRLRPVGFLENGPHPSPAVYFRWEWEVGPSR